MQISIWTSHHYTCCSSRSTRLPRELLRCSPLRHPHNPSPSHNLRNSNLVLLAARILWLYLKTTKPLHNTLNERSSQTAIRGCAAFPRWNEAVLRILGILQRHGIGQVPCQDDLWPSYPLLLPSKPTRFFSLIMMNGHSKRCRPASNQEAAKSRGHQTISILILFVLPGEEALPATQVSGEPSTLTFSHAVARSRIRLESSQCRYLAHGNPPRAIRVAF